MINKKIIRENIELLKSGLDKRNAKIDLSVIEKTDKELLKITQEIEKLNEKRNSLSKQITVLIKENKKNEVEKIKNEVSTIKTQIDKLSQKEKTLSDSLDYELSRIPTIPHSSVPVGKDETENIEVKKYLTPTKFKFKPLAHWDLAKKNDLIDFDRSAKVTGSRFIIYKNNGSKLIRALQQLTLDIHSQSRYIEFSMPVIVNEQSLFGTGQLPKFKEDLFKLEDSNYFLSPTGEVQLTNFHRDEILDEAILPLRYTTSTINFRSEAGSAGRDTRGVIRQHQFYKTEMVNIAHPNNSYDVLEEMTLQAEKILEVLKLPYRRIVLCTGDMGFSSAKTYDIEVWLPSYESYKEISSCSNCEDFQARRAMIRFKNKATNKNELVHTLNGSGLAIDRLWAAVVENYQNEDGSITIPDALIPYFKDKKIG